MELRNEQTLSLDLLLSPAPVDAASQVRRQVSVAHHMPHQCSARTAAPLHSPHRIIGIEFGAEKSGWALMSSDHLANDGKKLAQCDGGYVINVMRQPEFQPEVGRSSC